MAKIGTAHIEIKPVLNTEALDALIEQITEGVALAVQRGLAPGSEPSCGCRRCRDAGGPSLTATMVVCAVCGNKRCPKANDHRNTCTRSNEPGQPGSAY